MNPLSTILRKPRLVPVWRGCFIVLIGAVSWLALAPSPGPDAVQHLDKLRHLAAFAALAAAASMAWRAVPRIAAGLLAYGVLIELLQTQIPGRHGSAADVAADMAGMAVGLALAWVLRKPQ